MMVWVKRCAVIGSLVILIMTAGFLWFSFHEKTLEQDVVSEQLADLRAGNINLAYLLTSKEFQDSTTLNEFSRFVGAYNALTSRAELRITDRDMQASTGTVKGVLHRQKEDDLAFTYSLTKEDDQWKIARLDVALQKNPTEAISFALNNTLVDVPLALTNVFDNSESRYRIKYPASWVYEKMSDNTIIMNGKHGTNSYYSTVNIQTVLSKKTGGDFSTVKQLMSDIKDQLKHDATNVTYLENGPITITLPDGQVMKGEFIIFTYSFDGHSYKQWQVVVMRQDKQLFYAWAYMSPIRQYQTDFPTAKAIFESWVIY